MCAMIPMLRVSSRGWVRGISGVRCQELPAIVRESLVGFRHLVRVVLLLDGPAPGVGCVEQLGGELLAPRLFSALTRVVDPPADGGRTPAVGPDLDRNLIG